MFISHLYVYNLYSIYICLFRPLMPEVPKNKYLHALHPRRLTNRTWKWCFGSDDFPGFREFLRVHVNLPGCISTTYVKRFFLHPEFPAVFQSPPLNRLQDLFHQKVHISSTDELRVWCSFVEIYNEQSLAMVMNDKPWGFLGKETRGTTLLGSNISSFIGTFEDYFPFPVWWDMWSFPAG